MKHRAKYFVALILMVGLFVAGCQSPIRDLENPEVSQTAICGVPADVALDGPSHVYVGRVAISYDVNNFYVRYDGESGWLISSIDVAVAPSLAGIPQENGVPVPRLFPHHVVFDPVMDVYTVQIPMDELRNAPEKYVAAHAVMVKLDGNGRVIRRIDAWSAGLRFSGRSWETYSVYGQQACDVVPQGGLARLFRTQLQSQWGQAASEWAIGDGMMDKSNQYYLIKHFDDAFPGGLFVGHAHKRLVLSDADAVLAYLPDGAEPFALASTVSDPTHPVSQLAGELVALILNVRFDLSDSEFSRSDVRLADLLVSDMASFYYGLPVRVVLHDANLVLAGKSGGATVYQAWQTVKSINENFVDGAVDNGFLRMPFPGEPVPVGGIHE